MLKNRRRVKQTAINACLNPWRPLRQCSLDWVVKINRNLLLMALALGEAKVKEPTDSASGEDSAS